MRQRLQKRSRSRCTPATRHDAHPTAIAFAARLVFRFVGRLATKIPYLSFRSARPRTAEAVDSVVGCKGGLLPEGRYAVVTGTIVTRAPSESKKVWRSPSRFVRLTGAFALFPQFANLLMLRAEQRTNCADQRASRRENDRPANRSRPRTRAPAHPAPPRAPREHTREPCTPARAPPLMFDGPDRTSIANPAHLAPSRATAHAPPPPACPSANPAPPHAPCTLRAPTLSRAHPRTSAPSAEKTTVRPTARARTSVPPVHLAPSTRPPHPARIPRAFPNRAAASDAPPRTPSAHLEHGRRDRAVSQTTEASLYSSRVRTARRSRHAQSSRAPHTKQDQPRKTPRKHAPASNVSSGDLSAPPNMSSPPP